MLYQRKFLRSAEAFYLGLPLERIGTGVCELHMDKPYGPPSTGIPGAGFAGVVLPEAPFYVGGNARIERTVGAFGDIYAEVCCYGNLAWILVRGFQQSP